MVFHFRGYDNEYDSISAMFKCTGCGREITQEYEQVEAKGLDEL